MRESASARSFFAAHLQRSGYVTDGVGLFRVVAPLDPVGGIRTAVLEDCRTLAWSTYTATQLHRMRLRRVACS